MSGRPEGVSSTMTKVEIAQDIYLQMWRVFWFLMWKMFCHSYEPNQIKTDCQTCNLHTSQYINYKSVD